jgi:hypothetical protein
MYQRVDSEQKGTLEGFSYFNIYNEEEFVTITCEEITSIDIDGDSVSVYDKDIPKLINALQAAYDYKMKGGDK